MHSILTLDPPSGSEISGGLSVQYLLQRLVLRDFPGFGSDVPSAVELSQALACPAQRSPCLGTIQTYSPTYQYDLNCCGALRNSHRLGRGCGLDLGHNGLNKGGFAFGVGNAIVGKLSC
jgi:hypothetical protein